MSQTNQVSLSEVQLKMIEDFKQQMEIAQLFNITLRKTEVQESTKLAAAKRRVQEG